MFVIYSDSCFVSDRAFCYVFLYVACLCSFFLMKDSNWICCCLRTLCSYKACLLLTLAVRLIVLQLQLILRTIILKFWWKGSMEFLGMEFPLILLMFMIYFGVLFILVGCLMVQHFYVFFSCCTLNIRCFSCQCERKHQFCYQIFYFMFWLFQFEF